LEIKDQKPKIIKRLCELIQLKKIKKDEVSTFATYFDWQAERIYREYKKNEEKKNK
jgi:seryl-tRNA synthetase